MFTPQKLKFNKYFKIKPKRLSYFKNNILNFGDYGLKSLEVGKLKSKQLETMRRILSKNLKKIGYFWIRVYPNNPITKKPLEVRMGKGKGNVHYWICPVKKGQVLFEIKGVSLTKAKSVLNICQKKLSILTKFIY